jgi:hypothetical protein
MKKFLMIAAFALAAPLANAGDQAAKDAADQAAAEATQKADMAAVEVTETTGAAAEGAQTEAAEMTKEAEGTMDAAK